MPPPPRTTRRDFQQLARIHLRAARTLLDDDQWSAAYHIAGYAVECGLKACIAKQTRRHDFPRRDSRDAWTHDLTALLAFGDLGGDLAAATQASPSFNVNWTIVKDWRPDSRYDIGTPENRARDLYTAIVGNNGVMRWIRQRW